MRRVEGLAVVSAAWLLIAVLAGIPYMWNGLGPIDATFESMSGLTTTGATILRDFSHYGRSVFFWRSLTNWLGGMGVIALFVAILPRLAIGGREIFFAEASGPDDEKVAPQIRRTAALLWRLYAALTVLQIVALRLTGMPWFDSVCNTFGTIAAAAFSPQPAVDCRLPEPRRGVGDHRLHVHRRGQLRAAVPRPGPARLARVR